MLLDITYPRQHKDAATLMRNRVLFEKRTGKGRALILTPSLLSSGLWALHIIVVVLLLIESLINTLPGSIPCSLLRRFSLGHRYQLANCS